MDQQLLTSWRISRMRDCCISPKLNMFSRNLDEVKLWKKMNDRVQTRNKRAESYFNQTELKLTQFSLNVSINQVRVNSSQLPKRCCLHLEQQDIVAYKRNQNGFQECNVTQDIIFLLSINNQKVNSKDSFSEKSRGSCCFLSLS